MIDDELKRLLEANAEESRRQFDELRRHVDQSATTTLRRVDESATETRRYVDESATETRRHVDEKAAETQRYVDESATATQRHVDEKAAETHIRIEHLDAKIDLVAEAVLVLGEKVDREAESVRDEMRHGLADTQALVKFSYGELDRRVRTLEES